MNRKICFCTVLSVRVPNQRRMIIMMEVPEVSPVEERAFLDRAVITDWK